MPSANHPVRLCQRWYPQLFWCNAFHALACHRYVRHLRCTLQVNCLSDQVLGHVTSSFILALSRLRTSIKADARPLTGSASPTLCGETVDGDGSLVWLRHAGNDVRQGCPLEHEVPRLAKSHSLNFLLLTFQSVTSEESSDNDKELNPSSSLPVFSRSSTGMPSKFLMIFFTLSPDLPGSSLAGRGSCVPLLPSAAGVVYPYCWGSECQGWHSGSG